MMMMMMMMMAVVVVMTMTMILKMMMMVMMKLMRRPEDAPYRAALLINAGSFLAFSGWVRPPRKGTQGPLPRVCCVLKT